MWHQDVVVSHVLSTGHRRGAETYAYELACEFGQAGLVQRFYFLRAGNRELDTPEGVDVCVPESGLLGRLRFLFAFRQRMRKSAGREVVVCHGLTPLKFVWASSLFLRNRPRVVFQKIGFTLPWISRMRRLKIRLNRLILRSADVCLVLGDRQRHEVINELGFSKNKVHLVPNARRMPSNLPTVRRAEDLILVLGALSEEKQPLIALAVLKQIRDRGICAKLRFVGDGPMRLEVERLAQTTFGQGVVEVTGRVCDVWPHLCEATLLMLCSRTEGVPGVLVEAAFSGLPVVTWDVGDVASVVLNGVTGLVTPYGDVAGLRAAVERLLADEIVRERMGERARAQSSLFRIENAAEQTLQIIETLLRTGTDLRS
ncbi:MAG: glycosyltransferase family 4 protein [Thauera sp.]|nr:glycosyltransferase family 4 protein [Thauera sp.]